jgi:transposase-like protein
MDTIRHNEPIKSETISNAVSNSFPLVVCPKCGHTWNYKGRLRSVVCASCRGHFFVERNMI